MTKIKTYLILSTILYPLIFIAKYNNFEQWEKILVPTFVTLVFLMNWQINPPSKKPNIFLFLSFLFVAAGDYMINLTNWGGVFIIPFVLVHVCLIIYFSKEKPWKWKDARWLIPLLSGISAVQILSNQFLGSFTYKLVFLIYSYLLTTMLWRAICFSFLKTNILSRILVIAGATLFLITDVCVAFNIVLKTHLLVAITWICYVPALVMLSLMNALKKEL